MKSEVNFATAVKMSRLGWPLIREASVQKVERLSYFSMYPADYLLDTVDLSQTEHGAYCLMLFRYYWEGRLLVSEKYRGCRSEEDRRAADSVVQKFFHVDGEKLIHNRAERELEKARNYVSHQSRAGKRSAEVRAEKKASRAAKPASKLNGAFGKFWESYPRKKSKGKAERAWIKIRPDDNLCGAIIEGLERAKGSQDWQKENGRFIPHPATWLNARGWEDELMQSGGPLRDASGKTRLVV